MIEWKFDQRIPVPGELVRVHRSAGVWVADWHFADDMRTTPGTFGLVIGLSAHGQDPFRNPDQCFVLVLIEDRSLWVYSRWVNVI